MRSKAAQGSNPPRPLPIVVGCRLLAALVSACAPTMHTVEPYASDPARAALLQDHARAVCEQSFENGGATPSKPFITDGCSMWFDRESNRECCVMHDLHYWCGGSSSLRKQADLELRRCVEKQAPAWRARFFYWGVRVGGHPIVPTSFRWGFGRSYPSGYDRARSPRESRVGAGGG